jgi:hypothetical protein
MSRQDEDQDEREDQDQDQDDGDGQDQDDGDTSTALKDLDKRISRIEQALTGDGKVHKKAQDLTQARLAEPGDVPAQVRAELDRRDEEAKRQQTAADLGQLKQDMAALRDSKPKAPQRRVSRWMAGRDDG